jgi:hypothetical protein
MSAAITFLAIMASEVVMRSKPDIEAQTQRSESLVISSRHESTCDTLPGRVILFSGTLDGSVRTRVARLCLNARPLEAFPAAICRRGQVLVGQLWEPSADRGVVSRDSFGYLGRGTSRRSEGQFSTSIVRVVPQDVLQGAER